MQKCTKLQDEDYKQHASVTNMTYIVTAYSYVTNTKQFETLEEAREWVKEIEESCLAQEEIDPQDDYPVTKIEIEDERGNIIK